MYNFVGQFLPVQYIYGILTTIDPPVMQVYFLSDEISVTMALHYPKFIISCIHTNHEDKSETSINCLNFNNLLKTTLFSLSVCLFYDKH